MRDVVELPDRALVDTERFLASPVGSATAGECVLVWSPTAALRLAVLWGRPTTRSARLLTQLMGAEIAEGRPRYRSFVDLRRLEAIDGAPFDHFIAFMQAHAASFARQVERSAIVHRGGITGAAAAGYTRLVGEPFESRAFEDAARALVWLGFEPDAILAGVDDLVATALRTGTLTHRVRERLGTDLKDVSLASVASSLGVSPRSLQRGLAEARTSLRAEVRAARIERARERLADSDDKLYAIAVDLGFGSLQSFSDAFLEATGVRPRQYRDEHRRG